MTIFDRDLALIGVGHWGRNLARNFGAFGVLHTLCDVRAESLDKYKVEYPSTAIETDFQRLLRNPEIKKLAIATPAAEHFRMAKAALEAGKDVFVEKPLCLDAREAEDLVRIAAHRKRILMVGHLLQYHPCIEKLNELVNSGELGQLCYIASNRLNLGKIRHEENALWSFAPHDLSVILMLAKDHWPEKVRCQGGTYLNAGVADITMTNLSFATGIRAHIFVSWLNPFKEQKLTVVGTKAMTVFDDGKEWPEKLVIYRDFLTWNEGKVPTPNKGAGELVEVPQEEPLARECRHFLECCRDRSVPRTDGREGLRVLRILRAAQSSLEKDGEAIAPEEQQHDYYVHPSARVDKGAKIGLGTKIWHFAHVQSAARIGEKCSLGQNVFVDGAVIGNNVKIQNNVSVYSGVVVEDDVFLGPSCVLTNVINPRSQVNRRNLYEKTLIRAGATIGANATIVCGVTIGRYAFVAAGAVVTRDVADYGLVKGNPARQTGWMSRHGHVMRPDADGIYHCPESGLRYQLENPKKLRCLDLAEDAPLPVGMATGSQRYGEFKVSVES